jgi:tetratricopeptide (TPR) repeat protein
MLERAVELDPLCTMCLYHLSRAYMVAGRFDQAEEARDRYLLIGGGSGYYHYGVIKLFQGDAEAALGIFEDPTKTNEATGLAGRAMALYTLGRYDESDAALAGLIGLREASDPNIAAYSVGLAAQVFAWRNDKDSAFEWLDKALDDTYADGGKPNTFADINRLQDPLFRSLHSDPRWEAYRERTGLPTSRIESVKFSGELPQ